jgi:hypothetical protein
MYRIVKRIVHTVTTVTWLVCLEKPSMDGNTVEKEITFPASVSVTEEEVLNTKGSPKINHRLTQPTLDCEASPKRDEGEKHE